MRKASPQTKMEFTSDRMRLLAPLITERVIELARIRIMTGENFYKGAVLLLPDDEGVVKLALLVAHEMSPLEDFKAEEEALMRGIDSDTLRARKKAGVIRPL